MKKTGIIFNKFKPAKVALRTAFVFHVLLLLTWILLTRLPSFSLYDANPKASFNPVTHAFFWLAIDLSVLAIGTVTTTVDVAIQRNPTSMKKNPRAIHSLVFFQIVLVLGIIANCLHLAASITEIIDCRSTLCVDYNAELVTIIGVLALLIILEIIEFYYTYKQEKILKQAKSYID